MSAVPTARKSRRAPVLVGIVAVVLVSTGAAAAGYFLLRPGDVTVTGTVTLDEGVSSETPQGGPCRLLGNGFSDIPGARVTITDAGGTVVATTNLGPGKAELDYTNYGAVATCVFPFVVEVPGGEQFYGLKVGRREGMTVTREELNKPLELAVG